MATKDIIILDRVRGAAGITFRYALWADVPTERQPFYMAVAPAASAFRSATTAENAAITAGQVAERVDIGSWPAGTTPATIRANLQTAWQRWQAEVTGTNDWDMYGTYRSGGAAGTWTNGGAA